MKYRHTANGDRIPALGLGTWKAAPGEVRGAVTEALRIGYRHIDCAPVYQNEAEVGQALHECLGSGAIKREDLWITSKLWNNAHLPDMVQPALEKTLTDLQCDYLDLYLIHWPVVFRPEKALARKAEDYLSLEEAPILDTWRAMEDCLRQGLVKHIGVCNFSVKKLAALLGQADIRPCMNQVEMHPCLQQQALLDFCAEQDVLVTAYAPLGSGDRIKAMKKRDEPNLLSNPVICDIAERKHITAAQVLLAWALQRGTITIPKSVNPLRLQENLAAADLHLDDQDMAAIAMLDQGYRLVDGAFFCPPGSPYTLTNLWDA